MTKQTKIQVYLELFLIILMFNVFLTLGKPASAWQAVEDTTGPMISVIYVGSMTDFDPGYWHIQIEDMESGLAEVQIILNSFIIVHEQYLNGLQSRRYDVSTPGTLGTSVLHVLATNNDHDYAGDQEVSIYIETMTIAHDPILGIPCPPVGPCPTPPGIRTIIPDSDRDGVCDAADNCPAVPNPNQWDTDEDGIGDACEEPGEIPLFSVAVLMLPVALLVGALLIHLRRRKHRSMT